MTGQHQAAPASPPVARTFGSSRLPSLVAVAVCGFFAAGLVAGLWGLAVHGDTQFDVPWPVAVLIWTAIGVLTVLLILAIAMLLVGLVGRRPRTVVSADSLELDGRGVITLADATKVTFFPAQWKTWGRTKPGDPRRNLSVDREYAALTVSRAGRTERILEDDRAWRYVVVTLRGWVAKRPELAADDDTRRLLGPGSGSLSAPVHRPHLRAVYAFSAVVATGLTIWADSLDGLSAKGILGDVVAGLFWGGLLMLLFLPPVCLVLAVGRTVAHADLWRPFLPDDFGTYDWLMRGRVLRLARVSRRKGAGGLVWRWPLLVLAGLAPLLLPTFVAVELIRLYHDLNGLLDTTG